MTIGEIEQQFLTHTGLVKDVEVFLSAFMSVYEREFADIKDKKAGRAADLANAETALKAAALAAYALDTENKKPGELVSLRAKKTVNFDPELALKWLAEKTAAGWFNERPELKNPLVVDSKLYMAFLEGAKAFVPDVPGEVVTGVEVVIGRKRVDEMIPSPTLDPEQQLEVYRRAERIALNLRPAFLDKYDPKVNYEVLGLTGSELPKDHPQHPDYLPF